MLVDGPLTGVPRQEYRLNNLHLTKYRIKFPFTAPTRIVRKAWVDSDLKAQWKVSPWSVKAQNICKVCTKYSTTRESVSCVAHDDNWKFLIGIAGWYIYEASFIFNWNQRTNLIWRFSCKHQLNARVLFSPYSARNWPTSTASSCVSPSASATSCWPSPSTHWRSAPSPMVPHASSRRTVVSVCVPRRPRVARRQRPRSKTINK